jgi:hypothetical protein
VKKLLLTIFLFLICSIAHATTWYACTSGGNWSANVWTSVSADQGTCVAALGTPVAGDTAVMNSSSGNITITASAAAASVTMTGYTGTLAVGTQTLTVNGGTVTLGGTITATTGTLLITGTESLDAAGVTWPGRVNFDGAVTITLINGDNWVTTGLTTFTLASTLNETTSETYTSNGGLTVSATTGNGSALIILGGGTWSGAFYIENSLTLAGNITVSGLVGAASNTLTYSSGTITVTGSTLELVSETLNTSGMTWNTIEPGSTTTVTLTSNLNATTFLASLVGAAGTLTMAGAFNITVGTLRGGTTSTGGSGGLKLVAGQTLNVTTAFQLVGVPLSGVSFTILSATASSPTYLNYTGTLANENIFNTGFTDVQSQGTIIPGYGPVLADINAGTLTRTSGIRNFTVANINPRKINYFNGT